MGASSSICLSFQLAVRFDGTRMYVNIIYSNVGKVRLLIMETRRQQCCRTNIERFDQERCRAFAVERHEWVE